MQQFLNTPLEERFTDSWAFLMNYINSFYVVLHSIICPLCRPFQQPTLKRIFLSSLVARLRASECTTYRLPRCQLQTIIEQSKQKKREVKELHTFRFQVASGTPFNICLSNAYQMRVRWKNLIKK